MQPSAHSRNSSYEPNRLVNSANSEIIRMPTNANSQGYYNPQPALINMPYGTNLQSPTVSYSTQAPAVRTSQSQSQMTAVKRQESSNSVRDINQRLESISSGIKDGRPVISFGEGQRVISNEQRIVTQGGQSGGQSGSIHLPFPFGNNQQGGQTVMHQNQSIQPANFQQMPAGMSHSQPQFTNHLPPSHLHVQHQQTHQIQHQ